MVSKILSPEDQCSKVLSEIRSSNLHYLVQESPFSLYITVRKKFSKTSPKNTQTLTSLSISSENLEPKVNTLETQNRKLKSELEKKDIEVAEAKNVLTLLQEKLEKAEADFYKQSNKFKEAKEETSSEIKLLKESITKSNEEIKNHKKSLCDVNKIIKIKEKENYTLQQNLENYQEKNKALKDSNSNLKKDKQKSEKSNKKLTEALKVKKESVSHSILSSKQTQTNFDFASNFPTINISSTPNHMSNISPISSHMSNIQFNPKTVPIPNQAALASDFSTADLNSNLDPDPISPNITTTTSLSSSMVFQTVSFPTKSTTSPKNANLPTISHCSNISSETVSLPNITFNSTDLETEILDNVIHTPSTTTYLNMSTTTTTYMIRPITTLTTIPTTTTTISRSNPVTNPSTSNISHKTSSTLISNSNMAVTGPQSVTLTSVPVRSPRVDFENYLDAFKEFLITFKEKPSDEVSKHNLVATKMMSKDYNMFHVLLKDIRKFNPNLGGFMASQYKWGSTHFMTIDKNIAMIIRQYIADLNLGEPKNGLSFCLVK